jgi:outer membrane protein
LLNQNIAANEINKINYTQSKANRLPNLNFSDAQSLTGTRSADPVTEQYTRRAISANSAGLTSTITLFNGSRNTNLIKENELNAEVGDADIKKIKNDLLLNVLAAYTQVLYAYEAVAIAQTQVNITKEHLSYIHKNVNAGNMPESNIIQMQAQLASDNAAEVNAQNQLQLAKVTLMQLMELPIQDDFDIERPQAIEIDPDNRETASDIYNRALNSLPDIQSASLKTSSTEIGLKIAKAALMPKLMLSGNLSTDYSSAASLLSYQSIVSTGHIGYLANDQSAIVDGPIYKTSTTASNYPLSRQLNDNFTQGISLSLNVPLFNNLLFKSEVRRSQINIQIARLNETLTKNQVRKNIEIAYTDRQAAAKNFIATKKQLESEERSWREMEIKFKAGSINATDLFIEKANYSNAEIKHLQAKYEYTYKSKVVSFYMGGLTQYQ